MLTLPRLRAIGFLYLKLLTIYQIKQPHAQLIVNGLNLPLLMAKLIQQYCAVSNQQSKYHDAHLVFEHFD